MAYCSTSLLGPKRGQSESCPQSQWDVKMDFPQRTEVSSISARLSKRQPLPLMSGGGHGAFYVPLLPPTPGACLLAGAPPSPQDWHPGHELHRVRLSVSLTSLPQLLSKNQALVPHHLLFLPESLRIRPQQLTLPPLPPAPSRVHSALGDGVLLGPDTALVPRRLGP